jgi:hypothetical protein
MLVRRKFRKTCKTLGIQEFQALNSRKTFLELHKSNKGLLTAIIIPIQTHGHRINNHKFLNNLKLLLLVTQTCKLILKAWSLKKRQN